MSTLATATEVAGRMANDLLELQVNAHSPTFEEMNKNKEKCHGRTYRISVSDGMQTGTQIIGDGDPLPAAGNLGIESINVTPAAFISRVSVGVVASLLADGTADGLNLWKENAMGAGRTLGFVVGRSILDGYIAPFSGTVSGGSVTVTLDDVGGVRRGMQLEHGGNTFTVTSVSRTSGSFSGDVTMTTDAPDGAYAGGLRLLVSSSATNFVSLADAAGSGDIYGTTITGAKWQGVSAEANGTMSDNLLIDLDSRVTVESASPIDCFIANPETYKELLQSRSGRRFVNPAGEDDFFGSYKKGASVMGQPVLLDAQCPFTKVFGYSKEKVKLGIWHNPDDGGLFMDYNSALRAGYAASNTNFSYENSKVGLFQLLVRDRNAVGQLFNIQHSQ